MTEEKTYKSALKTTAIFGGVQVFQILLSIVRGKLVAVLLGSSGIGISTQYISSLVIISAIATLGLNLSGVRNIAQAYEEHDPERISKTYTVFLSWSYFTGGLGLILTIVFSPLLSIFAFQTYDQIFSFILLSLYVACTILWGNQNAILQGTKSYKELAASNLFSALISLVIIIPLYYILGQEGIVPGLILGSLISFGVAFFSVRQLKIPFAKIPVYEVFQSGLEMAKLGIAMMVTSLLGSLIIFIINTYITIHGSLSELGLYQSGSNITMQYVGLIFSAMAVGYFPQLAAVSADNEKIRKIANEQSEITILLISPIINILILLAPLVIQILLSPEFLPLENFIRIMCLGTIMKAASYPIGYISFAKGDKRTFFLLEGIWAGGQNLVTSILGYAWGGLTGMAIAYVVNYIIYFFIVSGVTYKLFNYFTNLEIIKFLMISLISAAALVLSFTLSSHPITYAFMALICVLSCAYSFNEIRRRVPLDPRLLISKLTQK